MEFKGIETGRFSGKEQNESMPPRPQSTILSSLAARSVFNAVEVEDAFQYLTDHTPHTKINLTVHQGVDLVEAAIKIAQVAGTTINTQVENILRILEARL